MITLREITEDNFEECIYLNLTKEQWEFIASNAYSLSEAYALRNHELYVPMPYVIYNDETMVGFVMAIYQPQDPSDPDDDEDIYYLARLMIDKRFQGKGFARKAMEAYLELLKTYPHGKATAVIASCDPNNGPINNLFSSLGFKHTDEMDDDGDVILRLAL